MKQNKKDAVFQYLRERIINGLLVPGSPINPEELAEELEVSKTPVREALHLLESERLVKNIPGRGSIVSPISSKDISDIFEVREIIECGTARRASFLHDKFSLIKKREEINNLCLQEFDKTEEKNQVRFWRDIHLIIVVSLENQKLLEFYLELSEQISRIRAVTGREFTRRRFDELISEHLNILDAIIEGDPEKAEEMVKVHLNKACAYTMEVMLNKVRIIL